VYRIGIDQNSDEYVEVRTNGQNYIVNYFLPSEKGGASSVAKDFVQRPVTGGEQPWAELVENIVTRLERLQYQRK